jgi:hypothetical protein
LTTSPTNLNFNESVGGQRRQSAIGLIFSGHDTINPIAAYATNSGTGTTITFPDTSSVADGDYILRVTFVAHEDVTCSFSSFTGSTTIANLPESGSFRNGLFAGFSVKSGAGAPGTDTVTLNNSFQWVSLTIVVKAAFSGGGLSITSVTPSSFDDGRTGIVIAGSGFGASQGSSTLTIGGQAQTVTAWSDTSITFTSVRGSNSMGSATLTLTKV